MHSIRNQSSVVKMWGSSKNDQNWTTAKLLKLLDTMISDALVRNGPLRTEYKTDSGAAKAINDWTPCETEDLARQLQKCTGYMLPSIVYPAIGSTKFAAFIVRCR